jgi:hypothetical protein
MVEIETGKHGQAPDNKDTIGRLGKSEYGSKHLWHHPHASLEGGPDYFWGVDLESWTRYILI